MGIVLDFRSRQESKSLRLREVVGKGTGEVTKWFLKHRGARAKFRIRIDHLQRMDRTEWNRKQFHKLDYGLAEFKWKCNGKEFRVIGFDRDGSFLMLLGCTHKQNVYDPPNWLNTARRLKGEVENGKWDTVSFNP